MNIRFGTFLILLTFLNLSLRADPIQDGLTAYRHKKFKVAEKILEKTATAGDTTSQFMVATMYALGQGVKKDTTISAYWYAMAANQGDLDAQYFLANQYLRGDGVSQNLPYFASLIRDAAKKGNVSAQYQTGMAYYRGWGVRPDEKMADMWFREAAANGSQDALNEIQAIDIQRDSENREKAALKEYLQKEPLQENSYLAEPEATNNIGHLSANKYSPESTSNQFGAGSPYDSNSINNPYGQYGSKYSPNSVNNPYATDTPKLYDSDGNYHGKLSSNPYDPDSTSNPYGRYGSKYSPDSINNPYGAGSPYGQDSPNNPYGNGMQIVQP
jgi:hypothetical protein